MKVYLAARFSRLPELLGYKAELEAEGIQVTSRWLLGGHEWVGTADEDIPIERNAMFALDDIADIEAADVIVCFTESPRSGPARGGRHVEMGYALAKEMPILVVGHRENVFKCLPDVNFAPNWNEALAYLREQNDTASCRVCGCTDDDCSGCVERTGEPCHWVEPDLCSACRPVLAMAEGVR